MTKAIRSELISLTETIVIKIDAVEQYITHDLIKEEKLIGLFYACLSSVDDDKKGKLISLRHKKTQDSSYGNRVHFYKTLVEQLAKSDERVARKVHAHIRKEARSLQKTGQYKKAASELCYALSLWKDDVYTYRLLADVFFRLKDKKNAYIAFGEVLRLCPEDSRLRKRMADYYTLKKMLPKAIHEYQILLKESPENLSFRRELGQLLYKNKSFNRVPDVLLGYYRAMPGDLECLNIIGNSYIHLHSWKQSVHYLQQSIKLNKSQPEIYQVLSIAFRKIELYKQSIHLLKEGIRFNPDSLSMKILLGTIYLECDMYDQVIETLQPILEIHPDSPSLLTTIGKAHFFLENFNDAFSMFSQAYEYKTDDEITLVMLARTYRKNGDIKNAEIYYGKAFQINSKDVNLQQELASFYVESGQWQKATEILGNKNDS